MKRYRHEVNCAKSYQDTCRKTPFHTIHYIFDYKEDQDIIESFSIKAAKLAQSVCPKAANKSFSKRSQECVISNCLAGVISEFCWLNYLNYEKEVVRTTEYVSAMDQIDLEVIRNNKKIEVRSSFPRNGIDFAICHPTRGFDVLGPYVNIYKPEELIKDYYVRALFPVNNPTEINNLIKSGGTFEIYLTGGATREMMFDDRISKIKSLIPEDNFNIVGESLYRVVPLYNALDSEDIYNRILTDE